MPGGRPGGGEYPGYAVGGVVPFRPGGRLVRAGERGTERIVSDEQLATVVARAMAMAGGGAGGGGTVIARIEIGGQRVKDYVIDTTQGGLRNGQIKVPDAARVARVY